MMTASTNTWRRGRSSFSTSREIAWKSAPLAWTRSAFCCLSAVIFTSPLKSDAVTSDAPPGRAEGGAPGCVPIVGWTGVG